MPQKNTDEPYSTILVRSRLDAPYNVFGYAAGDSVPGTPEWVARAFGRWAERSTEADTNLRVPNQWGEKAIWTGLSWTIPIRLTEMASVPSETDRPYAVTVADVVEFASRALLRLYVNDRAASVLDVQPLARPITWSGIGASQQIRFAQPVEFEPGYLGLRVDWPGGAPKFIMRPDDKNSDIALPVIFRLLTDQPNAEEAKLAVEKAALVAAGAGRIVEEAVKAVQRESLASAKGLAETADAAVEKVKWLVEGMARFMPPADISSEVYAEVRLLREGLGGGVTELVELLRAVRQGIKTR